MKSPTKVYLGDGLYCIDFGFQFSLSTLEGNEVFLDDSTLKAFIIFIERSRNVKIKVTESVVPDESA